MILTGISGDYSNANVQAYLDANNYITDGDSVAFSNTITFNNDVTFDTGVFEKFTSITGATGTIAHNCANGHIFYHTSISSDFTANFTNLSISSGYASSLTLILNQGTTAYIPTAVQIGGAAQTIVWNGGSPPIGTPSGTDAVTFNIFNVSGTYTVLGQLVDFS